MPILPTYLKQYWKAFSELTSSRSVGFGVGAILYSEISSYLNENQIFNLDDREQYRRYINAMDSFYVKNSNESNNK